MNQLVPCSRCARHVRAEDVACPFCGERVHAQPTRRLVARGATRAAIFYVGAAIAGCDDVGGTADIYGGPPEPPPRESIAQPYGAPPDPLPPPETPPLDPPEGPDGTETPEPEGPHVPEE